MQKRPRDRYQSASEMLMDIDAFRRDPRIQFGYDFFVDQQPTRYASNAQSQQRPQQRQPQQKQQQRPQQRPPQQRQPQRPEPEPEEDEGSSSALPIIGGIIGGMLILAAIIIGFCLATGVFAEKIEVPNFVGMNYNEQIRNNSDYAQLHIKINDSTESDTYEPGVVFDQSPSANVKIRPKEEITLYVAKARQDVEVPDVYTYSFTDAITMIEGAGFKYTLEYEKDSGAPEKTVIRTKPERYTWATKGTTVVLYVAAESDTVAVPKIVGYDLQTARELVQSVGLDLEVSAEENSSENQNVVLRISNYREDTQVPKGTVIGVVISNGKPTESTAKISFTLPDTGEDATVKVYLGNELLPDLTKTLLLDGSSHSFEVTSSNDSKKLVVKIGDETYYECTVDFTQSPARVSNENTHTYTGGGGEIPVGSGIMPSVEGYSYDEAVETLNSVGFYNIQRYDVSTADEAKNEQVFQQTPRFRAFRYTDYSTEIVLSVYTYEE